MGSSSYVSVADPAQPGRTIHLQFQYGYRREHEYSFGDNIQWEMDEPPQTATAPGEIVVPAWTTEADMRHFALTILDNRIAGAREIDEAEAEALEASLEIQPHHAWKKQ